MSDWRNFVDASLQLGYLFWLAVLAMFAIWTLTVGLIAHSLGRDVERQRYRYIGEELLKHSQAEKRRQLRRRSSD